MQPTDPEAEVLQTFEEIRRAMLDNDADALGQHVAEDYRGSDAGGMSHDRAQYLAAYGSGGVNLDTLEVSELETMAWTDTVLVTGVALIRGAFLDQRFEHRLRFLDAYRHRSGSWQVVASSVTDIVGG
jgi:hypothetical protein